MKGFCEESNDVLSCFVLRNVVFHEPVERNEDKRKPDEKRHFGDEVVDSEACKKPGREYIYELGKGIEKYANDKHTPVNGNSEMVDFSVVPKPQSHEKRNERDQKHAQVQDDISERRCLKF